MNTKTFSKKLSKAARVLGELAAELGELEGDDEPARGAGGAAARGFEGGVDHGSTRVPPVQTEIDEPEIGWRMGFIRLCDGRCPWCGERIELVTCDSHGTGLTWKCLEGCNP